MMGARDASIAVADARQVSIDGLAGTTYLDKVDDFKVKPAAGVPTI